MYLICDTITRWVGIKESGRPKPALRDSGRPRTEFWLTFRMKKVRVSSKIYLFCPQTE